MTLGLAPENCLASSPTRSCQTGAQSQYWNVTGAAEREASEASGWPEARRRRHSRERHGAGARGEFPPRRGGAPGARER